MSLEVSSHGCFLLKPNGVCGEECGLVVSGSMPQMFPVLLVVDLEPGSGLRSHVSDLQAEIRLKIGWQGCTLCCFN